MEKTETITSAFTKHEIQNLLGSKSCLQIMAMFVRRCVNMYYNWECGGNQRKKMEALWKQNITKMQLNVDN